jgi:hypothetical protein
VVDAASEIDPQQIPPHRRQALPLVLHHVVDRPLQPQAHPARLVQQVDHRGHAQLGRRRRRRRSQVGRVVDQRPVGLVPHPGHDRHPTRKHGANHGLVVERRQVLGRSPTPRQDHHLGPPIVLDRPQRGHERGPGPLPLHRRRRQHQVRQRVPAPNDLRMSCQTAPSAT